MGAILAVAVGGAAGSVLRFWLGRFNGDLPAGQLPWGTLTANVLGCLAIGLLGTLFATSLTGMRDAVRLGILVGVLGGFTTFSSFGLETLSLLQSGHMSRAALYVVLSNGLGLAAAWAGYRIAMGVAAT